LVRQLKIACFRQISKYEYIVPWQPRCQDSELRRVIFTDKMFLVFEVVLLKHIKLGL